MILRNQKPIDGRPGERLAPIDFGQTAATLERQIGAAPVARRDAELRDVPGRLHEVRAGANSASAISASCRRGSSSTACRPGEEITIDLEPGKTLVVKFLTIGEARPDGQRTVFFELNGQPREVSVRDRSLKTTAAPKEMASPGHPGHIGAPTPGVVTAVTVEQGQIVEQGQKLLILEAMKMQSTVYAPVAGKVARKLVEPGQNVETKELLLVIE